MRYKMIISDYGETLVHTGEIVDVRNVVEIENYQKKGGIFCIATGREWPSILRKINEESLCVLKAMPVICCYGAAVVLSKTSKVIFRQVIDAALAYKTTECLEQNGIPYSVTALDKTLFVDRCCCDILKWKKYSKKFCFDNRIQMLKHLNEYNIDILKIEIYAKDDLSGFIEIIKTEIPNRLKYFPNNNEFCEIVSAEAGKGSAVQFLSDFYNVPMNDLVVIGDAPNDMEMFDVAINKLAVSNAISSIKDVSSSIVDNNGYLGISRLIKDILGGKSV